jgi:hypothetical protein
MYIEDANLSKREAYDVLMEWSQHAIDTLKAQPHEAKSDFYTVITLVPNPSTYDGMHDAKVEIWRTTRDGRSDRCLVMMSQHHPSIHNCISDLNERINEIGKKNAEPEILALNGRKYRLIEIE